jgi:uncharacterized protein YjbI with pentapeptide repeats
LLATSRQTDPSANQRYFANRMALWTDRVWEPELDSARDSDSIQASLVEASLFQASLVEASLVEASLVEASLFQASLDLATDLGPV